MTYSLGIDLGTTYTAAAIVRAGRAEVVTLSYRATSIPTVVVLAEDGTFVVGDPAERRGTATPERLAREFKRRVGDPTPLLLGGTPTSIDRLLAEVIAFVHRTVSATEGEPPASTVVTHPANWGPFKRDVLVQALRLARIEEASLLPEPVAAATWYARAERLAPGATVAVYDLGGGTFDTVVLAQGADGSFAVRGQPEGVERLGGVDVDAAVLGHVLRVLGPAADGLDPDDPATVLAMNQLRRDCVEAKEALSSDTAVTIPVLLPHLRDQVLLQRRELEELIGPLLAPTTEALARVVASAGLGPGKPDAVLLVGGASRTPMVAREVTEALGRPVAVDAHPKHPVALGAALVAESRAPAVARAAAGAGAAAPSAAVPPPPPAARPAGAPRVSHRALLAVAAAVVVVAAAVALVRLPADGGKDRGAGALPTVGTAATLAPRTSDDARQAWTVDLGEQLGAPVTDGDHVYVMDDHGTLSALGVATGKVDWQADLGGGSLGHSPLVAGGVVLASASEPDQVQAFDKATGAVRWTAPGVFNTLYPAAFGDMALIGSGGEVAALGLGDGQERWRATLPKGVSVWSGLVVAGSTVVLGTDDGKVAALDAATGRIRFVTPGPNSSDSEPMWGVTVVGHTILAFDDDSDVSGVSLDTGALLWTLDAHARHPGVMAALGTDGAIALEARQVLVVDPATGRERRRLDAEVGTLHTLAGDPPVLVLAQRGAMRALRPDGRQAWSVALPAGADYLASARGVLAVVDTQGSVTAFRVRA